PGSVRIAIIRNLSKRLRLQRFLRCRNFVLILRMSKINSIRILISICLPFVLTTNVVMGQTHTIPLGGNTWSVGKQSQQGGNITKLGICNWSESEQKFKTFFRVSKPGSLYLKSTMTVPSGKSRIAVKIGDTQR